MNTTEPQMLGTIEEVKKWLQKMEIAHFKIHDDLTVDVNGDVILAMKRLTYLPVQFGEVNGIFNVEGNKLESLKGCPKTVQQGFYCDHNKLKSLEYTPKIIYGDFSCAHNKLTSLEFAPQIIEGEFNCSHNQLNSLCDAPSKVLSHYNCAHNQLTSLVGVPFNIHGTLSCQNNSIKSLNVINEVEGFINCAGNSINYFDSQNFSHIDIHDFPTLINFKQKGVIFISASLEQIELMKQAHLEILVNPQNVRVEFHQFKTFLEKLRLDQSLTDGTIKMKNKIKV